MHRIVAIALAVIPLSAAVAQAPDVPQVLVYLEWPGTPPSGDHTPVLIEDGGGNDFLKGEHTADGWRFALSPWTTGTLIRTITADCRPAVPSDTSLAPIAVQLDPRSRHTVTKIWLVPCKPEPGTVFERGIYNTRLTDKSQHELESFVQQARCLALRRIERVGNHWHRLEPHYVKVVFKYLEASRELCWKYAVMPSSDLEKACAWFDDASSNKETEAIVEKAVRLRNARKMVTDIRGLEAKRFQDLWAVVKGWENPRERYENFKAYNELLGKVSSQEGRVHIAELTVARGWVLSAMAAAIAARLKADAQSVPNATATLTDLIDSLSLEVSTPSDLPLTDDLRKRLNSDILVLTDIKEALESLAEQASGETPLA